MIKYKKTDLIEKDDENLLYTKDVAKLLNIGIKRVYYLVHKNIIPCIKAGNELRFEPKVIEKFLKCQK